MLNEIERKIDKYLNALKKERDFDENWFDVAGPILNLVNTAVGCKSKCRFCNRKCELGQHT
jgi:tRNA A37 methylthiotransferase MiaB